MKLVTPGLTKLGAALLLAAAGLYALGLVTSKSPPPKAAENPATQAAKRLEATAPEQKPRVRMPVPRENIEFSGAASSPALPKPGSKLEDLNDRFGVREGGGGSTPEAGVAPPQMGRATPNRATMQRAMRDMDRKRNWLVPGAQDKDLSDPSQALAKEDEELDDESLGLAKKEGVVERYITGSDSKNKRGADGKERDPDNPRDKRDSNDDSLYDAKDLDARGNADLDSPESNGLADFSLNSYLNPGTQKGGLGESSRKDFEALRTQQTAKDFGSPASGPDRSKDGARDREAHSADFQQLLKPRSGIAGVGGSGDPINSMRDLTRREMNPTLPRSIESTGGERSAFGPQPPTRDPIRTDSPLFGVTGPAASSLSPTISAPSISPAAIQRPPPRLIHEPPRLLQ